MALGILALLFGIWVMVNLVNGNLEAWLEGRATITGAG